MNFVNIFPLLFVGIVYISITFKLLYNSAKSREVIE